MADETGDGGTAPGIDYAALMRAALLDVVRRAMAQVVSDGLPGDHHFYLTFGSSDEGVLLPARLHKQFPDEITIVVQHQYWNLVVDDAGFAVTLRFGGAPERLVVPWHALRAFADPSVGFGLRLQPGEDTAAEETQALAQDAGVDPAKPVATALAAPQPEAAESPKVVDFGAFRRRSPDAQE